MIIDQNSSYDLHDAILEDIKIDSVHGNVYITIYFYESEVENIRKKADIRFLDVSSIACNFDFLSLRNNAKSGNIVSWKPCLNEFDNFIYFSEGYLFLRAKVVEMQIEQP